MLDITNKFGKFRVPVSHLRLHQEESLKVFGHFIIVKAEHLGFTDTIEYTAMSPLFDDSISESSPPVYLFSTDETGAVIFEDGKPVVKRA